MTNVVVSKHQPKSKDVTWIDMSSGSPVQKNRINGRWTPVGGGGGQTSNVIWPEVYEDSKGNEIITTFVPEDVKPNTWCMVVGADKDDDLSCAPVLIVSYGDYRVCNDFSISTWSAKDIGKEGTCLNLKI